MSASRLCSRKWIWLALPVLLAGCGPGLWGIQKDQPTPRPAGTMDDSTAATQLRQSAVLEGTVGAVCYVQGMRLMRVRGYGVVTGLNGKGSSRCRTQVRKYLTREISRIRAAEPHDKRLPPANELLNSMDTAVVEVVAEIPAGAVKGRRFDVSIKAEDPDTVSIAGGYLLSCDLRIFRGVSPEAGIEGRVHAKARGRIFINPFTQTTGQEPTADLREGRVIGGGINVLDRRLELVTTMESYSLVRQIMDTINRRFGSDPKSADAVSPTNVRLKIPQQYRGREGRFLDLIRHMPLTSSPAKREALAKRLTGKLTQANAPLEDIGLLLEGIGPSVLPMIQRLYTHPRRRVNYYAARVGLRLGDDLALEVVVRHTKDARSPFRLPAIRELGDCAMPGGAGAALRELLNESDPRIRILAYETLRKIDPSSISRIIVGHRPGNFILDIVHSEGPSMIYVRRSKVRRLALIGGDHMVFKPPLLYSRAGRRITLSAGPDARSITIIKKNPQGKVELGPYGAPLDVAGLVRFMGDDLERDYEGKLVGLGLDYAEVLEVLYRLWEKGSINADVMRWEETSVEEMVGPLSPMGRPESEL